MKTIVHSIITLSLVIAVLGMTSCQSSTPSQFRDNARAYNPSGMTPR